MTKTARQRQSALMRSSALPTAQLDTSMRRSPGLMTSRPASKSSRLRQIRSSLRAGSPKKAKLTVLNIKRRQTQARPSGTARCSSKQPRRTSPRRTVTARARTSTARRHRQPILSSQVDAPSKSSRRRDWKRSSPRPFKPSPTKTAVAKSKKRWLSSCHSTRSRTCLPCPQRTPLASRNSTMKISLRDTSRGSRPTWRREN